LNKKVGSQVQFESRRDNEIEESVLPLAIKILSATHATLFNLKASVTTLFADARDKDEGMQKPPAGMLRTNWQKRACRISRLEKEEQKEMKVQLQTSGHCLRWKILV
jgi:hypothetical protein